MKINQIFHHFSKWEDYKYGFYDLSCIDSKEHIEKSVELLSNQEEFYKYAKKVVREWVYSCEQNLTDNSINKIAYIGQSACCMANKTPAFVTRNAWWFVDDVDKELANETARRVLKEWRATQIMKGSLWEKYL